MKQQIEKFVSDARDWVRPRTASVAELTAQRDHTAAALVAAIAAIAPVQASFDDDPSDSAAKALRAARDTETNAREHDARAERLLAAAIAREVEEARQAVETRIAALDEQTNHAAVVAAAEPLDSKESKLLLELAAVRAARQELLSQFEGLSGERYSLTLRLGHPPELHGHEFHGRGALMSSNRIVSVLRTELGEHAVGSAMRTSLIAIIETLGGDTQPLAPLRAVGGAQ
jgi:hypothetical protein